MSLSTEELLHKIQHSSKTIIELGCGPYKKEGVIGIDMLDLPGVDYIADFEKGLSFLPDNSIDEIISFHVLEHIQNLDVLLKEIHRVLKQNGLCRVTVPHFSNPYYYSDYTHKRFFGLYTFDYFSKKDTKYKRKVPNFYSTYFFEVKERRITFKSSFFFRNLIKQIFNRLFNANRYMQELYEEVFCYWFPCQEITYTIVPDK
ncbi:MAG: class I SAM-dependent methyltransferase [Bacteroidia bacterium]